MQPEIILKSDVLDILFENRNKQYGAYMLRREYDARLRKAMLITFSLVALALVLAFSFSTKNNNKTHPAIVPPIITLHPLPKTSPPKTVVQKKHQDLFPRIKTQTIHVMPAIPPKAIIVPDEFADKKNTKTDEVLMKNIADTKINSGGNVNLQIIATSTSSGSENRNQTASGIANSTDNSMPFDNPDFYPDFPDGKEALLNFFKKKSY